ncbi:hypothetical protein V5799_008954 [Amblyomma americanum]|uniref:Uncharacterized protein n=1 Tax=Amblyomma americanum TaxID=6943 RepID=A0AAQ4FDJ4_AMBAM
MVDLKGVDPAFIQSPDQECIYLCGHIFGLKPKDVDVELLKVLNDWGMGCRPRRDRVHERLHREPALADETEPFIVSPQGCVVLWDIAHAVCNVELKLNEWKVDLAAWCTYKYMNCGPGTTGVAYVRHEFRKACGLLPELRGWWGNNIETRLASARCERLLLLSSAMNAWNLS